MIDDQKWLRNQNKCRRKMVRMEERRNKESKLGLESCRRNVPHDPESCLLCHHVSAVSQPNAAVMRAISLNITRRFDRWMHDLWTVSL